MCQPSSSAWRPQGERGTRVSEASTQLPEWQLPLETGSEAKAKQSKPAAGGAEHKVHCSGKSCSITTKA